MSDHGDGKDDVKHPISDILLAGAFAAFTIDLLVYPLDTIKTRFQSKHYARLYLDPASGRLNKRLMFRGMYQGVGSVIIATLPSSGAFFLTYETIKTALTPLSNPNSTFHLPVPILHSISSATAELVSCAILTPAEVIKQNAQMVNSSSLTSKATNSTIVTLRHFRSHPSSLFRGYTALAARNLPFTAMQFPMFENLKERIKTYRKEQGLWNGTPLEKAVITGVSAGAAGSVAAIVTTPIDVVKTRVMLEAGERKQRVQKGLPEIRVLKEVWLEGGRKALFRGGALRAVWTFLGSGMYLGVYDLSRAWLAERRLLALRENDIL